MAASLEAARRAKRELLDTLEGRDWLRGVGIAKTESGPALKVNVSAITDEVRALVPESIAGVVVVLAEVGEITAPPPPRQKRRPRDPALRQKLLDGLKRR